MSRGEHKHDYHLTTVNMPEDTDHPDISFPNVALLLSHVNATYPDHTSYLITVVRRTITKS